MIQTWFPTLIYNEKINEFDEGFNSQLYKRLKEIQSNTPKAVSWHCDTYSTLDIKGLDLSKEKYFSDLLETCIEHTKKFAALYNIDPKLELKCKDIWGNIAAPGHFQERHNHPNSHFSLVYYVKCPEDCGNIVFYSPFSEENILLPCVEANEYNYKYCYYEAKESEVLIFKSSLPHLVKQNKSNEDRCSIAMNFIY